jgi:hypothetical protein
MVGQQGISQENVNLHSLFAVRLAGFLSSCNSEPDDKPEGDLSVKRGAIYHSPDSLHYGILSADQEYRGLNLPKGSKIYIESPDFFYVDLSRETTVYGVSFPAGSRVYLGQEEAHLAKANLADAANIQGIIFPTGTEVYFGPDNRLVMAETQDVWEHKGFSFAPRQRLVFHDNGQLHVGRVAADFKPKTGLTLPAGTRVEFDREGSLATAVPSRPVEIDGKTFPANMSQISFHPTDDRFTAIIFAPGRIGDVDAPAGAGFYFQRGVARSVVMLDDGQTARIGDQSYEGTVFIHKGRVLLGVHAGRETVDGLALPQGTEVVFDQEGHLVDATLSGNTTIDGTQYGSGATLLIEKGNVVGTSP